MRRRWPSPYSTTTNFTGPNHFLRFDYQLNGNNQLSFRWMRERILTVNDRSRTTRASSTTPPTRTTRATWSTASRWTSVLNNRTTNEFRFGHVRESLLQGPKALFDKTDSESAFFDGSWKFVGFHGLEPFDIGSMNTHPDYNAGPRNNYAQDLIRDITVDDALTWIKSGWGGEHTFKAGVSFSRNGPCRRARRPISPGCSPSRPTRPSTPADPKTYPFRFGIAMGQFDFTEIDHRASGYVQDKWQINRRLTLNLGVRYDWQSAVPKTKNAIGPRVGVAYDATGDGKTLIRGGVGKVYQYQQTRHPHATLAQRAVIAPTLAYDTAQVTSPAITGVLPVKPGDANATACLQPVAGPTPGEAVMSPACRAFLVGLRNQVTAGGFVNTATTGPIVDGDRRMAYTWAFSAGVKRELANNMAVSVDYVGNRGRDNTAVIDINEGPVSANGRVTRLGVNVFDPTGALVPLSNTAARNTTFVQFNQEQTLPSLNTDFNSLELGLEKRYSNRWSGRVSYTLAHCYDVAAPLAIVVSDTNPRLDYGRCARDNRHAFAIERQRGHLEGSRRRVRVPRVFGLSD